MWCDSGRLQADGRGEPATASLEQLASSFSAAVDSCGQGEHSGSFAPETRIDGEGVGGREVTQLYPFLRSSRVWRRHVELEHSESPLLSLTLQHSNRVGVVVQYSASQLLDFTGLLYRCLTVLSNVMKVLFVLFLPGTRHRTPT